MAGTTIRLVGLGGAVSADYNEGRRPLSPDANGRPGGWVMKRFDLLTVVVLASVGIAAPASAQVYPSKAQQYGRFVSPQRNFSGLVSGYEAWQLTDIRRRAEIARQVDLNADMYWRWSGASSFYPGVFEPWPMIPGNVWGWPVAVSPPVVSGTPRAAAIRS